MEKHKSIIWITIFLIIIVSPIFIYCFVGQLVDSENYENRNMASKPIFTLENYELFPEAYEIYFNDNIPFRNQLIRFHNSIDYFLFHQSSNEAVVIGKNGWLFYAGEGDNAVEQSLGYWHFSQNDLQTIADNLMTAKQILESRDIEFVLFIAPNKETIYMEELPNYYEARNDYTSTDQLVDYLRENTDIRVVYPKQDLLDARKEYPDIFLYHKLDTHWNYAGGYIGAKCLAEELGIEMPTLDKIEMEPIISSGGDLANMLNIKIEKGNVDYDVSRINTQHTIKEKEDFDTEYIYRTVGADPRKLFVWRDSFSTALAPSLATQFENSLWVYKGSFEQQQIFDYDADIFVLEVVERSEGYLEDFEMQP